MDGLNTGLNRRLHTSVGADGMRTTEGLEVMGSNACCGDGYRFQWGRQMQMDLDDWMGREAANPVQMTAL